MLKPMIQMLGGLFTLGRLPDPRCGPEKQCSYLCFSEGLLEPSQRPIHFLEKAISCDHAPQA